MQNFNAAILVKAKNQIRSLWRAVFLQSIGFFMVTPILYGHPGNTALLAPAKPEAPSVLTLRLADDTRFNLAWSDNSDNEEGFQIERRLSTSTVFTLVETIGPNFEVFSDNTVARDAKYFYRVRAYNSEGYSSYSNIVEGTTPPLTPVDLTATPVSTKQIDLAWRDNSTTEVGFEIERRLTTSASYTRIATRGPNVQAFSDSGLIQNTKYFYRLRAINAGGESEYSGDVSATTLPTPPQKPSQLTATTVSSAQINLVWQDKSDNEAGFTIERKTSATGTYAQIALVGANVTNFLSTTLSPNTQYYYRVRAYNLGGGSAFSNEASATTLPTRPNSPSNLTATTVSNTRIDLAWQDQATNEDSFKIERRKGLAGVFTQIAQVGANVKKFTDLGLAANTIYAYRVRASNLGGPSVYSNEASATTLPNRPAPPTNLAATAASNTQIDLTWQDNATNEDSFKIERKVGAAGKYVKLAAIAANTQSFSDKKLAANTEYYYRLRAANSGGQSDYSNEVSAKTFPNPPGAPSNLTATTISNSRINLKWQDNATNEAGFQIERGSSSSPPAGSAGINYLQIAIVGTNIKQFADSGLVSNTLYFYRVRAFNTGNQTNYSNEASATTLPDRPAAPDNLTATAVSNMQIDLSWQDHATNEDSFKIERGSTPVGNYVKIATLAANAKSFSDKGLTSTTEYFYRLRAFNIGGESGYSNVAGAKTFPNPPGAPSNLITTVISLSRIKLTWQDNATNEEGFQIERSSTGASGTFTKIAIAGANATQFADSGLAANTLYFYRIRAFNTGNYTDYSNEASATTLPNKPATPGDLVATTVSNKQIKLTWQDNATNEDSFKIERKVGGSTGNYVKVATLDANTKGFLDRNLAANTEYFYRLRAANRGGLSDYSNAANAKTFPNPPAAPGNVTASTVSYNRINLAWKDNANNEVGFKIERGLTNSPDMFVEIGQVGTNAVSFADTGLAGNTKYFYRIRAYNPGGPSAYSAVVSSTTLPGPPLAPSSLLATVVLHNRIDLAWQDNAVNEAGFRIERKIGTSGVYEEIIALGVNATQYVNTGLTEKTQYFYRVRAYNAGGYSGYTEVLEVTTPPIAPEVPSNLAAKTVSNTQINLSWQDKSANEDSFVIERKLGGAAGSPVAPITYAELTKVGANVTSYTDKNLAGNTRYFYRVRAFNAGGYSDYSNEASTVTLPNPPIAPANLSAVAVSSRRINLTWQDKSSNEDSFKLERKLGAAGKYELIGSVGANVRNFADSSLAPNTPYFYRLRANNRGGFSGYSNETRVVTLPLVPATPGKLTANTVSTKRINLAWIDSSNNEVGFEVERRLKSAAAYTKIATVPANTSSYADSNLTVNTTYFYRVRALNTGGFSSYSNEISATTLPKPPAAPSQLIAMTVSNRRINLVWDDNSINEDTFKLERKLGGSAGSPYKQIVLLRANAKSFADTALKPNTMYFYRVRAYNRGGNSGYSNEANATTLPNRPNAPSNLTATTVSNTQIDLKWQDNAANEDSFKIERGLASSPQAYTEVARVGANETGYLDKGLAANTMYFYRVRAVNAGGHSGYSNDANATTLPNLPVPPTQLTAAPVSNKRIDLTWQDNSTEEDSFKIERKSGGPAGVYKQIAVLRANTNGYSDTTLAANSPYFYRVRTYNRGGYSIYSNEANARTLPNPPVAPNQLAATVVSNTQIDLSWQDKAGNETGFRIERRSTSPPPAGLSKEYVEIATVRPNVTSYSDSGLAALTTYFYRVQAFNSGGSSRNSNEAFATTLPNPPVNPAELIATPVSNKQIDLVWQDNSVDEDSFKIERRVGAAGKYKLIVVLGANTTKFSDRGLAPNTLYFYRVRANNGGGHSAYSNEVNTVTLPNVPAPPARLLATVMSQNQIDLAWADSVGYKTGFKIERKTFGGVYTQLDTVGANVKTYHDTGLKQDTEYFYRIRAYNAGGNSAPSNEVNARTFPTPPVAPVHLTATPTSSSQVDLAWADSSNNESGFKIERRTPSDDFEEITATGANVTNYSNLNLIPSTRYFFRVRAYNRGNLSAYSNVVEVVTPMKPPTAPRDLVATTRSNLQIDLEWLDTSSNEDSFKIERKISKTGAYVLLTTLGKDAANYSDVILQPVTQYFYRVRAVNSGGPSGYSNETGATTLIRPPAAPRNLTATTVSNRRIRLAWADSANNESGFQLDRKTDTSGVYVTIATLDANTKSLVDSSLSGGTVYFYRIRAYNTGGHSSYSNEAKTKTRLDPPGRPTNLIAMAESNTKIKLTWLDNSVNETGFQIDRKTEATGTFALHTTVGANVKNFIDSSLAVDSNYFYRVRAFNSGGNSNYSNEANAKTLPNVPEAPSALAATVPNARRVNLTWMDNSNNESGFQIERKTGVAGEYGEIGVAAANVKRFADSTVTEKVTYFYRVRAYNAGGSSAYANEVGATALPNVPLPPSNLTINSVSNRKIKLIWSDNSVNESNFRIERRVTATGTYTVVAAVKANVIAFNDTGLVALTPYYYRIYAFNAGGNSGYSNEVSATTLPNPPAKPDSLLATAINHSQINLQWKDLSDNENGFLIERKIGEVGKFVQVASVGAGVTTFFDANLAANKEYFYRVRALNAGGLSNYSNEAESMTLPIPPGSLTGGSLSNRRLYIAWTDSSDNESGFRIERRLFETEFIEIGFVGTNVTTFADSNLTPNTVYYYRVRAFNLGGLSAYSNEAPVATLPNAPIRPRALNVKRLTNLRLELAWTDSADNEIGFVIERRLLADSAYTEAGIVSANVTTFIDTGLVAETRYSYRVRSFNTGGYSQYSNEANNVTLIAPPTPPDDLSAISGSNTKINLLWQDLSNNESGFKIERKLANDTVYTEIAGVGANVVSYTDNQVMKDVAYMYRVRAFNDGGTSDYTDAATAIPSSEINFALGRPAVASSVDIVGTANRTVDGNLTTFWRSATIVATKPQVWLRVELSPDAQFVIDRVVIRWYQNFFATAFDIQVSDNGLHWTTVYTTEAGKAGTQEIAFVPTPARFVRLYMKRNNKANYRVAEFEVYNGLDKASRSTDASAAMIPATVTLQPNYPNPFNPATTISYALPEGMAVTLKVLNVAGQEVAILVNRRQERGIYRVTFNARKLPSGVYFTVLQAGEVRQVRQMLLNK